MQQYNTCSSIKHAGCSSSIKNAVAKAGSSLEHAISNITHAAA